MSEIPSHIPEHAVQASSFASSLNELVDEARSSGVSISVVDNQGKTNVEMWSELAADTKEQEEDYASEAKEYSDLAKQALEGLSHKTVVEVTITGKNLQSVQTYFAAVKDLIPADAVTEQIRPKPGQLKLSFLETNKYFFANISVTFR